MTAFAEVVAVVAHMPNQPLTEKEGVHDAARTRPTTPTTVVAVELRDAAHPT